MKKSVDQKIFMSISCIVLVFVTINALWPFILVFMSSITEENTLVLHGYSFFPKQLSLYAYEYIWANGEKIFRSYFVTFFVTLVGTTVNITMSSMLAYALSIKNLPGRRFVNIFVLLTLLFNGGLVPTYLMYTNLFQIKNTIFALIVPSLMMHTMNVLLMRTYFSHNIPPALLEAAEIDGANQFRVFGAVVVPLGKPIIVTMALFSGLTYWNDWTNGLYYLSGNSGRELYGIQNFLNEVVSNIQYLSSANVSSDTADIILKLPTVSVRMAIAFVAMAPILLLFPFIQKYFAKGISLGAVKG